MTERLQVSEDGVEPPPTGPGSLSRSSWLIGLAGFVLGLGLGLLVVNSEPAAEPAEQEVAAENLDQPADYVERSVPIPEVRLGTSGSIPGFPDAIVAVARTTGSTYDNLLWPLRGELNVRPTAGGEDIALDAASTFLAFTTTIPGMDGAVLSMGRYNVIRPVAHGVTGFAWHDGNTGVLSYTTEIDGIWSLYVVKPDFKPELITSMPSPGGPVVAWGDWGWVIQSSATEVALLNPDGEFKDVESGVAFASHRSGWVFVIDDAPKLVSAGGGVRRLDTDLNVGSVAAASFSPDGTRVAVAGELGVSVLYLKSVVAEPLGGPATGSVAWSSNSRFVIAPASSSGIVAHDIETASSYFVLAGHSVVSLGVVPLRSS